MLQRSTATTAAILFAVMLLADIGPALAQSEPKLLARHKDWEAYTYAANGKTVCFMLTYPTDTRPKNVKRGKIYAMVTHRPADKVKDEVSFVVGYPFKLGSTANVRIDNRGHDLFTDGETAWAFDAKDDATMVKRMVRGNRMSIEGMSQRGTKTTDRYSLSGFTAAYKRISAACK